jgi:xanthine dehydrogenase accessory factor
VTWVDVAEGRFPESVPAGLRIVALPDPVQAVAATPKAAEHLVMTYSHALDLALCHALLGHGFGTLGLIGSATKWARFRSRLGALGHPAMDIARITCPIGDPSLGKHPQAIAVGVAAAFLRGRVPAAEAVQA